MRYLYGDSVPFPPQYDFLAGLDSFIANAARAVKLDAEARTMHGQAREAMVARAKALEGLETFHKAVMRTIQETATRNGQPAIMDYARRISEHATMIVEEARRMHASSSEREQQTAKTEVQSRRAEVRAALEGMLKVVRLPTLETRVSMKFADNRNELACVLTNPDKIVTSFTLAAAKLADWQHPRKVSEFAQGVDLPVGVRRSLFKRTVQQEMAKLDDYYLGAFEMRDDDCVIQLRKRPIDPDTLLFHLKRQDTQFYAEVHYPGDAEAGSLPGVMDAVAAQQLERLWQMIRQDVGEAIAHKEKLIAVELNGRDVIEQDMITPFIALLIKMMAPIVTEISKRSPNPAELSLKIENESGRREEIYVRKADLLTKLEQLGPQERAVFASFGIFPQGTLEKPETITDVVSWEEA
jgi:hypothetical protein